MARIALPKKKVNQIVAEWRTGQWSTVELASKHKVSKSSVYNCVKGLERDCKQIVEAGIQYKQGLAAQSNLMVDTIETFVDATVQRLEYLRGAAIENVQAAMQAPCENQADYRSRGSTIQAAAETVSPKGPTTAIQVNNAVTRIEKVIVDHRKP